jgi:dTDP-4-amino-4,6-dideoxygalactose transaminase
MGPRVHEFEREFAELCRTEHGLAVSNGTAALHLALLAVGCGPGDEVILPSLNFVAAANVVRHTGATPVFCDVAGIDDLNLDPADVERAITPATKAILLLHYGGWPCDVEAVEEIARRHRVVLLEDAAHAPGASVGGRMCGSIGAVGCFSFFSNKNLPIGEGGMVVTSDGTLAERIRLLRSHGMTSLTWDRHRGHANSYDVVAPGWNYRLDEVRAAIGLVQLRRLTAANAERGRLAALYRRLLDGVEGMVVPFGTPRPDVVSAHHLAPVILPEGISRDTVRGSLADAGIQTSVHYPPIHTFTHFRALGPFELPRTEEVADRLLTLPLYAQLGEERAALVADELVSAVRGAAAAAA